MAKIPESMLEKIADLIIGEGYSTLPSRQRPQLHLFFNSVGLNFSDLESSRLKTIIRDLKILNIDSHYNRLPSEYITQIIEYMAHPSHFIAPEFNQLDMIKEINDLLNPLYLELAWKDDRDNVILIDSSGEKPVCYESEEIKLRKIIYNEKKSSKFTIKNHYEIFLSFASENLDQADEIYDLIKERDPSIEIFMSKRNLEGGDIWTEEIRNALYSSKIVILILTPKAIKKEWVLLESGGAWFQKKKIIPLIQNVDISTLPKPISENQGLSITTAKGIKWAIEQILKKYNESLL